MLSYALSHTFALRGVVVEGSVVRKVVACRTHDKHRKDMSVNVAVRSNRDSAAHPCLLCLHMCAACLMLRRGFHIEGAGTAAFP